MASSTRREILSALLGSAFVGACAKKTPSIGWDGRFVDPPFRDGHKLRDGFLPDAKDVVPETVPVLILGGGVAGLVAGWSLKRAGVERFKLLEMADEVGGTSVAGRSKISEYPWGAHYLPAPHKSNPELIELLSETGSFLGHDAEGPRYEELHLCASPKERVFFEGLWYPGLYPTTGASAEDITQFKRFEARVQHYVGFKDAEGRRAFSLPLARSSDAPDLTALDRITMSEWMKREGFTSKRLLWYVNYACKDDFGANAEACSAWYGLHYFCARVEAPEKPSAEFLTWPEGNAFLTRHLARRIGEERILSAHMVVRVSPHSDGRRAEVLAWDRKKGKARRFVAERVIFALPSFLRSHVLKGFEGLPAYQTHYAPWLVANVHLSGWPGYNGFHIAWDNVIYGSASLGYVVATHQGDGLRGPKTVWTYYLPLAGADIKAERQKLLAVSWKEASDAVLFELDRCHLQLKRRVTRVDIMRWGHGMVRPEPGVAFSSARSLAATPFGPLHFAHTDLSGVALFEEAFYHGSRAAAEVRAALSGGTR